MSIQVTFPHVVPRQGAMFSLMGQAVTAGFGLSGASIVSASNSAHWRARVTFVVPHNADHHLAMEAFVLGLRGALGTTLVPAVSKWLPSDHLGRRVPPCQRGAEPHTDSSWGNALWDHSGLGQTPNIHATLAADAALRDGKIEVTHEDTFGLRPGQYFSLGEDLHQVTHAYEEDGKNMLHFQPLLRQAWVTGERVIIDRPHCRMRLASPNQGDLDGTFQRMQSVTLDFVEDVL